MSHFVAHRLASCHDRNHFSLFRHRFELTSDCSGELRLFADTRYRLTVNDRIVGYGPTRFYPTAPEFDTYDLARYLRSGLNEIRVEVNSRNAPSFQAVPSAPAFWAQGLAGPVDLSTPGAWQVKVSHARSSQAPAYSFAQGPVEILNLAHLAREWAEEGGWEPPVATEGWGEARPRSVPMPSFQLRKDFTPLFHAPLQDNEERLVFHRSFESQAAGGEGASSRSCYFGVALPLYSPVEQDVPLGLFWSDNYLGGQRLILEDDAGRGCRQNVTAHFRLGWNLYYGQIQVVQPAWGFLISWPRAAGLSPGPQGLLVSEAMELAALEQLRGPLPTVPEDIEGAAWLRPVDVNTEGDFPAREVAWDLPCHPADNPADNPWRGGPSGGGTVMLWECEREFLGHFRLRVQAQAEAIIDLVADEQRRQDGSAAIYGSNPFFNAADRFIVPAGESVIEAFHPRGGRFAQVTARSTAPVQVLAIEERSALLELPPQGHFECDDEFLNQLWRTGAATVEACLPDVWVDCPWREQGAYQGDTLVEWHATRSLLPQADMGRRALRLWAQGQREDGLLPACVPAWYDLPHADFSLLYVLLLRDFWAQTGEGEIVAEVWPVVQRIMASPLFPCDDAGLWTATPQQRLFIDWGIPAEECLGSANGVLNALRVGALQAVAQLAPVVGQAASPWAYEAERVAAAFRAVLWRPETQDFAPYAGAGQVPAHHANILALCFGLATPEQEAGVLQNLRAAATRYSNPAGLSQRDGHVELYFAHFVLQALASRGLHTDALAWVRAAWAPMIEAGEVTFWETLHRGIQGKGSRCHAWSCAPVWFLAREVLGVQPVQGNPNAFHVNPHPAHLKWARGFYPHPNGPIEVRWHREGESLKIEAQAPAGVELIITPQP